MKPIITSKFTRSFTWTFGDTAKGFDSGVQGTYNSPLDLVIGDCIVDVRVLITSPITSATNSVQLRLLDPNGMTGIGTVFFLGGQPVTSYYVIVPNIAVPAKAIQQSGNIKLVIGVEDITAGSFRVDVIYLRQF